MVTASGVPAVYRTSTSRKGGVSIWPRAEARHAEPSADKDIRSDPESAERLVAPGAESAAPAREDGWLLRAASSLEDYVSNPFGRYFAGQTFAAYWTESYLNGLVFWGRTDEDDIKQVTRALDAVLIADRVHEVLIDASGLSSIDARAFVTMAAYMGTHRAAHARLCRRQALVRPGGMAGAVVAGFYQVVRPGYPVAVFDDPAQAVSWLELPHGAALVRELERIRDEVKDTSAVVLGRVRSLLGDEQQDLGRLSLDLVAARLTLTPRTLQRRLVEAGTSFRAEINTARLRLAKSLLANTDYDLKRISFMVGCSSAAQFSSFFRRSTNSSPKEWRAGSARRA